MRDGPLPPQPDGLTGWNSDRELICCGCRLGTTLLSGEMGTEACGCKHWSGLGAIGMGDARDDTEAEAETGLETGMEADIDGVAVIDDDENGDVRESCCWDISSRGS